MIEAVSDDADLEALFIDSTIVHAHQHAAGAKKRRHSSAPALAQGRLSTKIHAVVDALGNPLRWRLTGGEVADITQAGALIEGLSAEAVIGDKRYNADALVATAHAAGVQAVIPPRSNRTTQRAYVVICVKTVISLNAFSIASSNSAASPPAMTNSHATSCSCSISCAPTSGWHNC